MTQNSKKIQTLEGLEKKVKRRILQGKTEEAIDDLRYIISQYKELQMFDRANVLELTLNQFISETPTAQYDEPQEKEERKGKGKALDFLHRE
ncbi:MAG: hypothetical protein HWN65_12760 [Candidatus Helarchaeota archaeon]|nr:hypothetical protein [Candidatus Helarchaeota archaeon]